MDTPEQRKADKSRDAEPGDFAAQRGRRTAYGSYPLVLQPGEKLETEEITITAMRAADSVEITCSCTKARRIHLTARLWSIRSQVESVSAARQLVDARSAASPSEYRT